MSQTEFDGFAENYDRDLARGLSLTGEGKDFYARARIEWLRSRLEQLGIEAGRVLDFGCGTGTSAPLLREVLGAEEVLGVDPSTSSLEIARARYPDKAITFAGPGALADHGPFDLAFTNGVFHHVPRADRDAALATVAGALRPGGYFALWENNPWNPGTRWIMRRVAFDRDAVLLTPGECRRRLVHAGLGVVAVDHLFVFPRFLRRLRPLERHLTRWPIGGQYQVLSRKAG